MKVEIDLKTLAVGIVLGVIFTCTLGFNGSADRASFGLAVQNNGMAIVQTENGNYYVINPNTGMASIILTHERDGGPADRREDGRPIFPRGTENDQPGYRR